MNVPSHNLHLPATDLCHGQTLNQVSGYMNAPTNKCPSNWVQDQVNKRQNQLSNLAQCIEHLNHTHRQDAQLAFARGFDHGSTTPKTTTNVMNMQLHCGTNCHAPDFPPASSTTPDMATALANAPLHLGIKCSAMMPHLVTAHTLLMMNLLSHSGQTCSAMALHLVFTHDSENPTASSIMIARALTTNTLTDWTPSCANWGQHLSATLHHGFLHQEYADSHNAAFWVLLLLLKQLQTPNKALQLFLMIIQGAHNHQPHVLVAHSWFAVDAHSAPDLSHEVMQFGRMLPPLLWLLCHVHPADEPVSLSKCDIIGG